MATSGPHGSAVARSAADRNWRSGQNDQLIQVPDDGELHGADNLVQQETSQPAGSNTHQLTYTLDANGNRTYQTDQASQQVQYEYYTDNKLRDWFDPMRNETFYKLDNTGNIIGVYQPSIDVSPFDADNTGGTPIVIGYTQDNLPYQVIEPVRPDGTLRRVTSYTFDLAGRRTQTQVQLANYNGGGWGGTFSSWNGSNSNQSLAYLADDRISSQTGRYGETISSGYDPAGNVLSATEKNGSGATISTSVATFYLDSLPRTVDDGIITSKFAYDGTGAVTLKAQVLDGVGSPNTYSHLYTYNDAGKISALSSSLIPSGQSIKWWYDQNGRFQQQNFPNGAQASWTWNNDDTLATVAITNSGGQYAGIYTYAYDSTRRVLSQALSNTGTSADGTFSYQYDAAGRLTSFVNSNNATYTVSWDHDGNRLSYGGQTFTYNADDSMASSGTGNYGYGAPGLMASDGCMSYAYDGFDRLSQVSATGSCTMTPVNYAYDSFDRQISRSWSSGSTAFHYDGLSPQTVLERTTGVADTVYDTGAGGESVAVNQGNLPLSSAGTQYILDDGHTNAAFIANASSTTVCVARFDPWGSPFGTGTSYAQPCTGGAGTIDKHFYRDARLDESTGYYQFGSRTYAPPKASFIEPDTYRTGTAAIALSVGTDPLTRNRYGYVNGDPVNHRDPSGHMEDSGGGGTCDATCQQNLATDTSNYLANQAANSDYCDRLPGEAGQTCSGPPPAQYTTPVVQFSPGAFTMNEWSRGRAQQQLTAVQQCMLAVPGAYDMLRGTSGLNTEEQSNLRRNLTESHLCSVNAINAVVGTLAVGMFISRGSTGRTSPTNLKEKLAMQETRSSEQGEVVQMKDPMNDPRWPAKDGWVKMSRKVTGVTIHYVYNTKTGEIGRFQVHECAA